MLPFLSRVVLILGTVVVLTTGAYFASGGTGAVGLSDWLVVASFITLVIGTIVGTLLRGIKGPSMETPADTPRQRYLRQFFRAGPFMAAFTAAAVLSFVAAILVDVLFSPK
jgi:hypothetical protein